MLRPLLAGALAALALAVAPAALASGTSPGVLLGGGGIAASGGTIHYVAVPAGSQTMLESVRVRDGKVLRFASFAGQLGVPVTTFEGSPGGLSADGSTLVLADATQPGQTLRKTSSFVAVFARNLTTRALITLHGDFSYDALSPDGTKLYLVQHVSSADQTRYVVRAYDVDNGYLLPGTIADKSQVGWVMAGMPVARATGPGGRWVYTLYQRPGGTAFVHALDTETGVAHCTGIPFAGDQSPIWNLRLSLAHGGRTLSIHWRTGRSFLLMDTRSWRLSTPSAGGFQWWIVGAGVGGALALLAAAALLRRALRAEGPLEARPA
jgi:hypothetical protein